MPVGGEYVNITFCNFVITQDCHNQTVKYIQQLMGKPQWTLIFKEQIINIDERKQLFMLLPIDNLTRWDCRSPPIVKVSQFIEINNIISLGLKQKISNRCVTLPFLARVYIFLPANIFWINILIGAIGHSKQN